MLRLLVVALLIKKLQFYKPKVRGQTMFSQPTHSTNKQKVKLRPPYFPDAKLHTAKLSIKPERNIKKTK